MKKHRDLRIINTTRKSERRFLAEEVVPMLEEISAA